MESFLNSELSFPHPKACNCPFHMISGMILGTGRGNVREGGEGEPVLLQR